MPESTFLSGKHSGRHELRLLSRALAEYVRGLWALRKIAPAVAIFGSARISAEHPHSQKARELARALGLEGYAIITGGGPGIMEAANHGAREAKATSVGCTIELPREKSCNRYVDLAVHFHFFFVRKAMLIKHSCAFIIFPGGFGTLDEMTEAVTLIRTGKLDHFPVILVGREYWRGFHEWLRDTVLEGKLITAEDLKALHFADETDEIVKIVRNSGLISKKMVAAREKAL